MFRKAQGILWGFYWLLSLAGFTFVIKVSFDSPTPLRTFAMLIGYITTVTVCLIMLSLYFAQCVYLYRKSKGTHGHDRTEWKG